MGRTNIELDDIGIRTPGHCFGKPTFHILLIRILPHMLGKDGANTTFHLFRLGLPPQLA